MSDVFDVLVNSPLEAPDPDMAVAERLVLLVHRGVNWDVWGSRRLTYWDALCARVKAGTYAGPTLGAWWQSVCNRIDSHPRSAAERRAIGEALDHPNPRAVLRLLRDQPDVIVLHVRVALEHARAEAADTAASEVSAPGPLVAPEEVPA